MNEIDVDGFYQPDDEDWEDGPADEELLDDLDYDPFSECDERQ